MGWKVSLLCWQSGSEPALFRKAACESSPGLTSGNPGVVRRGAGVFLSPPIRGPTVSKLSVQMMWFILTTCFPLGVGGWGRARPVWPAPWEKPWAPSLRRAPWSVPDAFPQLVAGGMGRLLWDSAGRGPSSGLIASTFTSGFVVVVFRVLSLVLLCVVPLGSITAPGKAMLSYVTPPGESQNLGVVLGTPDTIPSPGPRGRLPFLSEGLAGWFSYYYCFIL